jgi:hypothetical protein
MTDIRPEARGRLREFKKQIAKDYKATDQFLAGRSMALMTDFARKRGTGRERVFHRWNDKLAQNGARLEGLRLDTEPVGLWSHLKARETINVDPEHPRDMQDCVCVNYIALGAISLQPVGAYGSAEGLWTAAFTDHALHQYLDRQRSDDHSEALADLRAAIFAAHRALLNLDASTLERFARDQSGEILLPVKDTVWAIEMSIGHDVSIDEPETYILVRTALALDQLSPRQEKRFIRPVAQTGGRLGEGWLLPRAFRRLTKDGDRYVAMTRPDRPPPVLRALMS